jgi:hypothetical protein
MSEEEIAYAERLVLSLVEGQEHHDVHFVRPTGSSPTPDIVVPSLGLIVEVKRIIDRPRTEESAKWSESVSNLRDAIHNNPRFGDVRGYYVLTAAYYPIVRRGKIKAMAALVVDALLNGKSEVDGGRNGPRFEIKKYSEDFNGVDFSTSAFGWGDPAATVAENVQSQLAKAAAQLSWSPGDFEVKKRVVLLVSTTALMRGLDSVVDGLARIYSDLLSHKSIDEIWCIRVSSDGLSPAEFAFGREEAAAHEDGWKVVPARAREWLEKWFYNLSEKGEAQRSKLVQGLLATMGTDPPHTAFPNAHSRTIMVRSIEWLIAAERGQEAIEMAKRFVNDPDPNGPEVGPSPLHEEIRSGSTPSTITTVLGSLAWSVQKIALRVEYFGPALDLTKLLLDHTNLYVKFQACVPLIELAVRARHFRTKVGDQEVARFKAVLLSAIREYSVHPAIARKLAHAATCFLDFSESESVVVIDALQNEQEAGPLLFLLAYPLSASGEVSTRPILVERLHQVLLDSHSEQRGKLVWWLCRQLLDSPDADFKRNMDLMGPLIELIWRTKHDPKVQGTVSAFMGNLLKRDRPRILRWNLLAWTSFRHHLTNVPQEGYVYVGSTAEFLGEAATSGIDLFTNYLLELFELWKAGAHIGKPHELFQAFQQLPLDSREDGRRLVSDFYLEMRKMQPDLPEATF